MSVYMLLAPMLLAVLGVGIGWWGATLRIGRPPRAVVATPRQEPIFRRPLEFGPILQPREVVDRIRDAIIEDQLGARKESPKQRRQRLTRYRPFTDRQRVQHWLLHWREDYVYALTGAGWATS